MGAENRNKDCQGISRRDFLRLAGTGVLAGAAAALPGGTAWAAEERPGSA